LSNYRDSIHHIQHGKIRPYSPQEQAVSPETPEANFQLRGGSAGSYSSAGSARVLGMKEVGNMAVYGVESFTCHVCHGDMSCKACRAKVNEARNEFRWVYITRLLCIRAQRRTKNPRGLGAAVQGLSRVLLRRVAGLCESGPAVALENSRRAAQGGRRAPNDDSEGSDGDTM
jgi:hypothetical protein